MSLFSDDRKLPFIPLDTAEQTAADAAVDAVPDAFEPQKQPQAPVTPRTFPKASSKAAPPAQLTTAAPKLAPVVASQLAPRAPPPACAVSQRCPPVVQSAPPDAESLKDFSPLKKDPEGESPHGLSGFTLSPARGSPEKCDAASDTDSAPPLPQQDSETEDCDILAPPPCAVAQPVPPHIVAPLAHAAPADPYPPPLPSRVQPPSALAPAFALDQTEAAASPAGRVQVAAQVAPSGETWACEKCTFQNCLTAVVCATCGGPRYCEPKNQARQEFTVVIEREPGDPVGLDIDHIDGVSAVVEAVKLGGSVHLWNQLQPQDSMLREGDRIVEVNGARDDVQKIIARLKSDLAWRLVFHRPVELSVVINKQDASTLGLDLKYAPNSKSLLITDVANGPMRDWNLANPDQEVMIHDRIVEINGVRGRPQALIEASDGQDHLNVVIAHYPSLASSLIGRCTPAVGSAPVSSPDRSPALATVANQTQFKANAPSSGETWACRSCTFENSTSADSCKTCGAPRYANCKDADVLAGQQFIADIERRPGEAVGLDIDHIDGVAAVVEAVKPGGAIQAWNAQHAEYALKEGDRIIEVNGAHGDVKEIIQRLKGDLQWRLIIQRPVEILITIRKTDSSSLGLDLNYAPNSKSLLITDVSNGPMQDWNVANRAQAITSRDRIVEINGIRGRPQELIHASEGADVLQMVIAHYAEPSL